jgi:hypothetical protein
MRVCTAPMGSRASSIGQAGARAILAAATPSNTARPVSTHSGPSPCRRADAQELEPVVIAIVPVACSSASLELLVRKMGKQSVALAIIRGKRVVAGRSVRSASYDLHTFSPWRPRMSGVAASSSAVSRFVPASFSLHTASATLRPRLFMSHRIGHTRAVQSADAVTTRWPSGLKAADKTDP